MVAGAAHQLWNFTAVSGLSAIHSIASAACRLVAAMAVDDQDAAKALRAQAVEDVPDQPHIGFGAQR